MTRQPDIWRTGPPSGQALPGNGGSVLFGTYPMNRERLARYDFYSIEFLQDGESLLGFLSHDPMRDLFAIVYSVIEQGVEKRRALQLSDDQIEKISYDEATEILVLH